MPITVPVTKPKTIFSADMALRCRPGTGGYLRASVTGIDDLRWPHRTSVARLVAPNATWRDDMLGVVVSTAPSFTFTLGVPDPSEVVSAIIGERGWRWEVSDKGRYAQSLAATAGDHVAALASSEATDLVTALASLNRKKAEQLLRQLRAPERELDRMKVIEGVLTRGARWRTLGEIAGDIPNGTKANLIPFVHRLLEAGLIRRAFKLECRNCRIPFHVELNRADDIVACPGCMTRQVLAGRTGQEPLFVYALNSLLDRAIDQDCVSHLLAELWTRQSLGVLWAVPGANVVPADGPGREIDLLAIARDALIVGELKARSASFSRAYVRNLAELARNLNADVLLLGSLDDWSDDRRADVTAWVGSSLRTIVVARADLLRETAAAASAGTRTAG